MTIKHFAAVTLFTFPPAAVLTVCVALMTAVAGDMGRQEMRYYTEEVACISVEPENKIVEGSTMKIFKCLKERL